MLNLLKDVCCFVQRSQVAAAEMTFNIEEELSYGDGCDKKKPWYKVTFLNILNKVLQNYSCNNLSFAVVEVKLVSYRDMILQCTVTINGNVIQFSITSLGVIPPDYNFFSDYLTSVGYPTTLIGVRDIVIIGQTASYTGVYQIQNNLSSLEADNNTIVVIDETHNVTLDNFSFNLLPPLLSDTEAQSLIQKITDATKNVGASQFQDCCGGGIIAH